MLVAISFVLLSTLLGSVDAFAPSSLSSSVGVVRTQWRKSSSVVSVEATRSRRDVLETSAAMLFGSVVFAKTESVSAADGSNFTPGGTLVDRPVGVTVGNSEASASRAFDNANVLFKQDHYFKFGVAPAWIEPESVDFPKTMPFTLSQQRYDNLKKYGSRVQSGFQQLSAIANTNNYDKAIISNDLKTDAYQFRPMGLLANGFLASENTGTTNELLLARWYINEMYLQVNDILLSKDSNEAMSHYESAKKAANSYIQLMNRVITPKVGDKLPFI